MIDVLENLDKALAEKENAPKNEGKQNKLQKNYTYKRIEKQQPSIRPNKKSRVLSHLKAHGSITPLDAIRLYSATRLAAIIHVLRKHGYLITTEDIKAIDKYGYPVRYARYHLIEYSSCQE